MYLAIAQKLAEAADGRERTNTGHNKVEMPRVRPEAHSLHFAVGSAHLRKPREAPEENSANDHGYSEEVAVYFP